MSTPALEHDARVWADGQIEALRSTIAALEQERAALVDAYLCWSDDAGDFLRRASSAEADAFTLASVLERFRRDDGTFNLSMSKEQIAAYCRVMKVEAP